MIRPALRDRARAPEVEAERDDGRALCADSGTSRDMWSDKRYSVRALAAHMCGHCPILDRCRTDGENVDPSVRATTTWGGVIYGENGRPLPPSAARTCSRCGAGQTGESA